MAKKKPNEAPPVERKRIVRSSRWDPELLDAIGDYIADQEVPPTEISVMETAVRAWLSQRGYWPRSQS